MIEIDKSETIRIYPKIGIGCWVIKIRIMLYLISTTHCMIHQHNVYIFLWVCPSQIAQHWLLQYLVNGEKILKMQIVMVSWVIKTRILALQIVVTNVQLKNLCFISQQFFLHGWKYEQYTVQISISSAIGYLLSILKGMMFRFDVLYLVPSNWHVWYILMVQ